MAGDPDLEKFLAETRVSIKLVNGDEYAYCQIPKVVKERFAIRGGDSFVFFDQQAYLELSPAVADRYDWLRVAIRRRDGSPSRERNADG